MLLSCLGDEKNVDLLLRNGANIDAKDKDEKTPLYLAVENGKLLK